MTRHVLALSLLALVACGRAPNEELEQRVEDLAEQVQLLRTDLATQGVVDVEADALGGFEMRSVADIESALRSLKAEANARSIADRLSEVDSWVVMPEEEERATAHKRQLVDRLRLQVQKEVAALQDAALKAPVGREALARHSEAAEVLGLYPVPTDDAGIAMVRTMTSRQSEVLVRIEVLRRQRYNLWATKRIGQAMTEFHNRAAVVDTKAENDILMRSLVNYLAEVDPALLEPAVLDLYRYVLDLTKSRVSESQKVKLVTDLVGPSPSKRRLTLGDF